MSNISVTGQESYFNEKATFFKGIKGDLEGNVVGNLEGNLEGNVVGTLNGSFHSSGISTSLILDTNKIRNSNNIESIILSSEGYVTKPEHPVFYVEKLFGNTNTFISGNGTITTWNSIKINKGSHFTSGNGRFTAPVSGVYNFTFHISALMLGTDLCDFAFSKNNSMYSETIVMKVSGTSATAWFNGSLNCYMELNKNEFATVDVLSYSGNAGTCRASFGGTLIS